MSFVLWALAHTVYSWCSCLSKSVMHDVDDEFDLLEWYHHETSHPSHVFFFFVVLPLYVLFGNTSRDISQGRGLSRRNHIPDTSRCIKSERVHTWMFGWGIFSPEIYCESLSLYKMVNSGYKEQYLDWCIATYFTHSIFHCLIPSFSNSKNTKCHTICHIPPNPLGHGHKCTYGPPN